MPLCSLGKDLHSSSNLGAGKGYDEEWSWKHCYPVPLWQIFESLGPVLKSHKRQLEGAPTGQIWDTLNNKINETMAYD